MELRVLPSPVQNRQPPAETRSLLRLQHGSRIRPCQATFSHREDDGCRIASKPLSEDNRQFNRRSRQRATKPAEAENLTAVTLQLKHYNTTTLVMPLTYAATVAQVFVFAMHSGRSCALAACVQEKDRMNQFWTSLFRGVVTHDVR